VTNLSRIATCQPKYRYSLEDMQHAADRWRPDRPRERELCKKVLRGAGIGSRAFAVPLETVLSLNGMRARAEIFNRAGTDLGAAAAAALLDGGEIGRADIRALLFTSCSIPAIPSVDVQIIERLGLSPSLLRVPVFQQGCGGAAAGLALADRLAAGSGPILLISVELCSLVYQRADFSGANLVGSALFADGAAAALVTGSGGPGLAFCASRSALLPDSSRLMGYEIRDDGTHLYLAKELPACVSRHAPPLVRAFLAEHGLAPQDVPWWAIHPGGVRVLQAFESGLGLERGRLRWSWEVLAEHGNMSSASILFVLQRFMTSGIGRPGQKLVAIGLGPGISIEMILFELQ